MSAARNIPDQYERLAITASADNFFAHPMEGQVNGVWMPREITGDYNELARQLYNPQESSFCQQVCNRSDTLETLQRIATFDDETGHAARQVLADQAMVENKGLMPDFRVVGPHYYDYDIYKEHMDLGNPRDGFGTFSCGYTDPTTSWARNEDCETDGVTRFGAPLFRKKPEGKVNNFAVGDLFRMAAHYNINKVAGFIHWAERTNESDPLRMMLMARHKYE